MIGYYVHHHGAGHAHRFLAVRELIPGVVGLGSGPRPEGVPEDLWVTLPHDATAEAATDPTAGGALHWAPLGEPGLRARTLRLAQWAGAANPEALVVDVSVEIALAARLLSIPTVVIAQHGDRSDGPHTLAYRSAAAVAALWRPGTAPDPSAAGDRLHHVGPISRFDGYPLPPAVARPRARRRALLLMGRGGHDLPVRAVRASIDRTAPSWSWDVLGDAPELGGRDASPDAVWAAMGRSDVVIAPASNNCVAEVAAAGKPLIAIPQDRPFAEQHAHARTLAKLGVAESVTRWPEPSAWPALLERTVAAGAPEWDRYSDGQGARRLAAVVSGVAGQERRRRRP